MGGARRAGRSARRCHGAAFEAAAVSASTAMTSLQFWTHSALPSWP